PRCGRQGSRRRPRRRTAGRGTAARWPAAGESVPGPGMGRGAGRGRPGRRGSHGARSARSRERPVGRARGRGRVRVSTSGAEGMAMRIGLLTSVGPMLDQFFPEIVREWEKAGHTVRTASGTPAEVLPGTLIGGLTRRPALSTRRAQRELRVWSIEEALDVVVTNSATASALVRTAGLRAPVVYFCHGLHWNRLATPMDRMWETIEHQLLVRTAGVLTLNSDDEAWFRRRLPD